MITLESTNTHLDIKETNLYLVGILYQYDYVSQIGHNVQNKNKNKKHSSEMKITVQPWVHSLFVFNFHK